MSETKLKTRTIITEEELLAAENELRSEAKSLYASIETTYWELGRVLYEVFDGVPGGYRELLKGDGAREARREIFRKWGYSSFEEYCEREIGIQRRSASSLRHAYWWFEIKLQLPTELKDQLKKLGRSRIYVLSGFVDNDNIMSWLEKASTMTVEELRKAVNAVNALKKKPVTPDDQLFEYAKAAQYQEQQNEQEHLDAPALEQGHTLMTNLYEGQWNTWNQAFDRAKNITKSDKVSHNLEMICQDYLATNDFADPKDDLRRYMAKMEKMTGMKIIAIDPHDGKAVYGADLLWALVQQRVEFQNTENAEKAELTEDKPKLRLVETTDDDGEPPAAF